MTQHKDVPSTEENITNDLLIALYQHGGTLTRAENGDIHLLPGQAPEELIAKIQQRAKTFQFRMARQGVGTTRSLSCPAVPPPRYMTVRGCRSQHACGQIGPCANALMRRDCLRYAEVAMTIPEDEEEGERARLLILGVGPKRTKEEQARKDSREAQHEQPWVMRGRLPARYPWYEAQAKHQKQTRRKPPKTIEHPSAAVHPRNPGIRLNEE